MTPRVEFTADGALRLPAEVASRFFPEDALVAQYKPDELWLFPLVGPAGGGLLLKQRNAAGDRSTLIWEALQGREGPTPVGSRPATWDEQHGALRVELS